uniref:Uncharacterized protein n=1 Tax=Anopheles maculatus TaxID=74869 RepID=A0A182TB90_9DIPT
CYDQEESSPSTTTDVRDTKRAGLRSAGTGNVVVVTANAQPTVSAWSRTGAGDELTYAEIVAGLRRQRQRGGHDPPLHVIERQHNVTNISITSPVQRDVPRGDFDAVVPKVPVPAVEHVSSDAHQAARTVVQLTGANRPTGDEPIARDPPKEQRKSRRPPPPPSPQLQPIRSVDTTDSMTSSIVNVTTIVGATSTQPVVVMTSAKGSELTQPEVSSTGSAGPTSVWSFGNKTYAEVLKEIAASNQYRLQQQQLQQQEFLQPSWNESSYQQQYATVGKQQQQFGTPARLGLPQSYANRSRSSSRNRPKPEAVSRIQSKDDKLLPVPLEPSVKANEAQRQVFVTEINVNKSESPTSQSKSPMKTVSIVNLTDRPEVVASAETKITINVNEPVQAVAELTEVAKQEQEHYVTQIRLDQEAAGQQRRQQVRKSAKKRNKTTTTHKLLDISMSEPVTVQVQELGENISTVEIVSPKEKNVSVVDLRPLDEPLTEKNVSVVDLRPLDEPLTVTSIELKGAEMESLESYSKQIELQLDAGSAMESSKVVDESVTNTADVVQDPVMFTEEIVQISQPCVTIDRREVEESTVQQTETVSYHRSEVSFTTVTETVHEEIKVEHKTHSKESSSKTYTTSLHIEQTNVDDSNTENVAPSTEIPEVNEQDIKPPAEENVAKESDIWCPPTKKKGKKKQAKKSDKKNDDQQDDTSNSQQVIEQKRTEFGQSMLTETIDETTHRVFDTKPITESTSDVVESPVTPSAEEVALMSAREESFLAEMSG